MNRSTVVILIVVLAIIFIWLLVLSNRGNTVLQNVGVSPTPIPTITENALSPTPSISSIPTITSIPTKSVTPLPTITRGL